MIEKFQGKRRLRSLICTMMIEMNVYLVCATHTHRQIRAFSWATQMSGLNPDKSPHVTLKVCKFCQATARQGLAEQLSESMKKFLATKYKPFSQSRYVWASFGTMPICWAIVQRELTATWVDKEFLRNLYRATIHFGANLPLTLMWKLRFSIRS